MSHSIGRTMLRKYSDDCEEEPMRGTCTRKSLEATCLPHSSFACIEQANSSFRVVSNAPLCPKIPHNQDLAFMQKNLTSGFSVNTQLVPNCSCPTGNSEPPPSQHISLMISRHANLSHHKPVFWHPKTCIFHSKPVFMIKRVNKLTL